MFVKKLMASGFVMQLRERRDAAGCDYLTQTMGSEFAEVLIRYRDDGTCAVDYEWRDTATHERAHYVGVLDANGKALGGNADRILRVLGV